MRLLAAAALLVLALACVAVFIVAQPMAGTGASFSGPRAEPARLEATVRALAALGRRDDEAGMMRAAAYLHEQLLALGYTVTAQDYRFDNGTYRNLIAAIGPQTPQKLVVGAHYDVRGPWAGADDNSSGTAGLLELARLLHASPPRIRTELVLYPREEVKGMGSEVHAKSLDPAGVRAMVVLEMIGCFSGPQKFPLAALGYLYPAQGDYIVVVGRPRDLSLVRAVKRAIRSTGLGVESFNGPEAIPGIGNSDHRSYWRAGITAAMVTDTSWYRNPRYHTAADTPDTLDYARMAQVVEGVAAFVTAVTP